MISDKEMEYGTKLSVDENTAQCRWFRHLILVMSTLLGVLVSLRGESPDSQLSHYCYGIAVLLLSLGNMGLIVQLYIYSVWSAQKLKEAYHSELRSAYKENRNMKMIGVSLPEWRRTVEYISYGCISLSFVILGVSSLIN